MIKIFVKLTAITLFLFHHTTYANTIRPCSIGITDSDRDGWGWEDGASCRIRYPLCESEYDTDGDGWGWLDDSDGIYYRESCLVYYPDCALTTSDPDNDGWGWENGKTCIVPITVSASEAAIASAPGLPYIKVAYGNVVEPNYVDVEGSDSSSFPVCESPNTQSGFIWENDQFCISGKQSLRCSSSAIPIYAQGWGWDNGRLCLLDQESLTQCDDAVEDLDRDGWALNESTNQSCIVPPKHTNTRNISVNRGYLIDTNGKVFIPRGIKLELSNDTAKNSRAIQTIADTGANMLDLHLATSTVPQTLDNAIALATARDMVSLVSIDLDKECGIVRPSGITTTSFEQTWLKWASVLLKEEYQPFIAISLANGDNCIEVRTENSDDSEKRTVLRNNGFTMPFVLSPLSPDAPPRAQPLGNLKFFNHFKQKIAEDPQHNLIFSLKSYHPKNMMDGVRATRAENIAYISRLSIGSLTKGFPQIEVDYQVLANQLQELQNLQSSWTAESWTGSGIKDIADVLTEQVISFLPFDQRLSNISLEYEYLKITDFGEVILNGEYGIKNTSVKASSFAN